MTTIHNHHSLHIHIEIHKPWSLEVSEDILDWILDHLDNATIQML